MNYYLKNMLKFPKRTVKMLVRILLHRSESSEITVDHLLERMNSNLPPLIIDVRSAPEFNGADGHIPNAKSIPIGELSSNLEGLHSSKEKEIVTICPGGGMSLVAVDILVEAGFENAKSLHGGYDLWVENGYPTTTS
ncbi:MAG: rhodanese-like domain-containing protein [Candidatus Thorarchaeota archaeon]|nr:rhodanese-like domain-containing protein [Candidatus Thorarchaeota archaeon]